MEAVIMRAIEAQISQSWGSYAEAKSAFFAGLAADPLTAAKWVATAESAAKAAGLLTF